MTLTAERLREVLHYDPETGVFTRLRGRAAAVRSHHAKGYLQIGVDYRKYLAHRLAWLYVKSVWPENQIDHIDRDPANNRFVNLREATNAENNRNTGLRKDSASGFKGVSKHRRRWQAYVVLGGRQYSAGVHATPEAAAAARSALAARLHGEFARAS